MLHVEAAPAGGFEQGLAAVRTGDDRAGLHELFGQHAVAAAEVENALAGPGRQPRKHVAGHVGYEAGVLLVFLGAPDLAQDGRVRAWACGHDFIFQ